MVKLKGKQYIDFLDELNSRRQSLGMNCCEPNEILMEITNDHVQNMKKYNYCAHSYFYEDTQEFDSIYRLLILYGWAGRRYGECVQKGTNKGKEALIRFAGSTPHWDILTYDGYDIIGIAKAQDYWCVALSYPIES